MAGPLVKSIPDLRVVQQRMRARIRDIIDLRIPNQQVGVFLFGWVQRNFASQGALVGNWSPFARGGRWVKGKGLDTSAKLLQDTGALRQSFRPFWNAEIAGIGSDIEYSKPHQEGTARLPQRRMLPEEGEVLPNIVRIYDRHTARLTRKKMW